MDPQPTSLSCWQAAGRAARRKARALCVLRPALAGRGKRPLIFLGASVGAVNAVAGLAHLSAEEVATQAIERWRHVTKRRGMGSILARRAPVLALRWTAKLLSLPRGRSSGLLDTAPLRRRA